MTYYTSTMEKNSKCSSKLWKVCIPIWWVDELIPGWDRPEAEACDELLLLLLYRLPPWVSKCWWKVDWRDSIGNMFALEESWTWFEVEFALLEHCTCCAEVKGVFSFPLVGTSGIGSDIRSDAGRTGGPENENKHIFCLPPAKSFFLKLKVFKWSMMKSSL